MPFTAEFVDEGRALRCVGSGVLTGPEILATKTALAADECRLGPLTRVLVDLLDVTALHITADEVRLAANDDLRLTNPVAIAIVAANDYVFAIARMWQVFTHRTPWRTAVFRTQSDAEAWLRTNQRCDPE